MQLRLRSINRMEQTVNANWSTSAIEYGLTLVQETTHAPCGVTRMSADWQEWYQSKLWEDRMPRVTTLRSIWSLLRTRSADDVSPKYIPPLSLSTFDLEEVEWLLNPQDQSTLDMSKFTSAIAELGEEFARNWNQAASEQTYRFDCFYSLMQKYASTLPCTYGERGVSLFQQWRMVVALMAIAKNGDARNLKEQKLALIGLDLPGIQETVYTIASRGAGKSVRGRSAFVQLLVNAIVDRLIDELGLCRANVIVNAGGNALILAEWSDTLETKLRTLERNFNELLLRGNDAREFAGFQGDLALALAWIKLPWAALKYPCATEKDDEKNVSLWQFHEKRLKEKLQQVKLRPLGALLDNDRGFAEVFGVEPIDSSRCCAVCRRPEFNAICEFEPWNEEESETPGTSQIVCPMCKSFRDLADSLGKQGVYLNRSTNQPTDPKIWQVGLHAMSGYWYSIDEEPVRDAFCLAFSPDDFPNLRVHGFWPLATTTPRATEKDAEATRQRGDLRMKMGDIRDNAMLAENSPGTFKRLGVLKADVDDLGTLLVQGLQARRSAALTATLSESLTLFFGGWLDKICAEEPFRNNVYVLYAGGDDLLILGTWHVMPLLAARIAHDFALYTGQNPGVHLSAGISIVGGKEPLYAAVDAANKALKKAKRYPMPHNPTKNAIGFLGRVVNWADFADIETWRRQLNELLEQGAPRSLLMTLLQIYTQYEDDHRPPEAKTSGYATRAKEGNYMGRSLYLGPWLWQMIYRLHRLVNPALPKEKVQEIQQTLLQTYGEQQASGVEKLALSARWVQLLAREK